MADGGAWVGEKADFFISYTKADEAKAEWIAQELRRMGRSVRFAKWELTAGDRPARWMERALEASERLIMVCSPAYFDARKRYSADESEAIHWSESWEGIGGAIVPVLVAPGDIPKLCWPYTRINLTGVDEGEARERLRAGLAPAGAPPADLEIPFAPTPAAPDRDAEIAFARVDAGHWPGGSAEGGGVFLGVLILVGTLVGIAALYLSVDEVRDTVGYAAGEGWFWGVVGLIGAMAALAAHAMTTTPASARWLQDALRYDRIGEFYRSMITGGLDRLDRRLSDEALAAGRPATSFRVAWSAKLFEAALGFAILYPFLGRYLFQLSNAAAEQFADSGFFALFGLYSGALVVASASLAVPIFAVTDAAKRHGMHALGLSGRVLACLAALAYLLAAPAILLDSGVASTIATVFLGIFVYGAIVFAIFAPVIAPFIAAAIAVALGFALGAAGVVIRSVIDPGVTFSFDLLIFSGIALVVAGIACAATFAAAHWLTSKAPGRFGRRALFYVWTSVLVLSSWAVIVLSPLREQLNSFVLFLGLLPWLNSAFDFLSIGLTRWALRRGARPGVGRALFWSAVDLVGAALLLVGLIASAVLLVHWIRDGGGAPLLDLNELFLGVDADPGQYWWLYLTFFSTLLPTALHLALAILSLATLGPAPLRRGLAWAMRVRRPDSAWSGVARPIAAVGVPLAAGLSAAAAAGLLIGLGAWVGAAHPEWARAAFSLTLDLAATLDCGHVAGLEERLWLAADACRP